MFLSIIQESLTAEAEIDELDNEQTWPTEEELQQADGKFTANTNRKL